LTTFTIYEEQSYAKQPNPSGEDWQPVVLTASTSTHLAAHRRYTLKDVARILNVNHEYLWQCLRSALDESFRKRRKIPRATLESLPLKDWKRQGRRWVIAEADLLAQLT
jgi:hypothetical protein